MMAGTAGDTALVDKGQPEKPPEKKKTKFDVIIIGAGPAGYTAGIYCSRARQDTLILSGILPGGQLVNTTDVENYPGFENGILGPDLMIIMRKQTERMGTTIIDDEVVNVDFKHKPFKVLTASEEYEAKAVIICTGANPRKLGLEGEKTFAGKGRRGNISDKICINGSYCTQTRQAKSQQSNAGTCFCRQENKILLEQSSRRNTRKWKSSKNYFKRQNY